MILQMLFQATEKKTAANVQMHQAGLDRITSNRDSALKANQEAFDNTVPHFTVKEKNMWFLSSKDKRTA